MLRQPDRRGAGAPVEGVSRGAWPPPSRPHRKDVHHADGGGRRRGRRRSAGGDARRLSAPKAYVNDGGDIAWHLRRASALRAGIVADQDTPAIDATVELRHAMPVRGMATSGWRGRSFSLGIADAVTVLAASAAQADAAATLIANAVDCAHPAIRRTPAHLLRDDTDLGDRLVTVAVGPLPAALIAQALERGAACAQAMREAGLIHAAWLALQGQSRVVGPKMPPRAAATSRGSGWGATTGSAEFSTGPFGASSTPPEWFTRSWIAISRHSSRPSPAIISLSTAVTP